MKRIIAGLLALMLLFSLCGCRGKTPTSNPNPTTQPAAPPAADAYIQAAAPLREAKNVKVLLNTKKTITALGGTLSSSSKQVLTLTGIGTDAFAAALREDMKIGESEDRFTEYFANGVLYVNVYDTGYFQGNMTTEEFMARFAPAVLLDEALYTNISDSGDTLTFSDPTGPESWALPEGAKFLNAGGTAKITDGTLTSTDYTINYAIGNATVSLEVSAQAELYNDAAPEAPQDTDSYIKIDSLEVPRLFDTAVMYICNSKTASSHINQTIICEAAGYTQIDQIQLHHVYTGNENISNVEQSITSFDSSGTNTYTLDEHFRDGQYTYSENGGTPTPNANVTASDMVDYILGFYTDNIPALQYITSAKLEDVNGLLCLEMGLDSEWGKLTVKWLSEQLFQDKDFLDDHSTAYETTENSFYMFLDPATGFPVSAGLNFTGIHTIEGGKYGLSQELAQSYQLADCSTYIELTDEIPAETAPTEQATPLLYRVTGSDGQEMYLMGTIHIGDEKTGFLPDEVYAAFAASDALAVEVDTVAFEKKLENDSQLSERLSELFVNPNNSTTKSHLDPELYEVAVKLLKASGDYDMSIEYVKPYIWSSSIENFFLTLSTLRSEKGMDMRLLRLAEEQNKKVLEVESGLFQMEMFANFSYDLQEILLGTTAATTVKEYCAEAQELYDLWCAGDESVLREKLKDETSGMTDEELALYKEYTDAVIIERNDNMLDVAVSYLEGEDTVFFAVGLAHLLQENGLVDTLRAAGYTVEQVIYN